MFKQFTRFVSVIMIFTTGESFIPSIKPEVKTWNYQGDIKPFGYFDPALLTTNLSDDSIKYVREAEIQHSRVAMVAFLGLVIADISQNKILAIDYLYSLDWESQSPFWLGVGIYEFARMGAGWKNPFVEKGKYFKLEEHYQPGNVFKLPDTMYSNERLNRELSNGRLAMFGTLGYIAQELIQQQQIV